MAEGNPFFALELARGPRVPPSAWAAITDRVLDLDEPTAALLRRLAVVGDDLDPFDVPALAGLPEPAAFALLDVALDAGALVAAGTRYRFRHDLVRQALVEQVPPHRRLDIHRDAARSLAAAGRRPEPGGPALARRRPPGRGRAVVARRGPAGVVAGRVRRRARPARSPAGAPARAHRRAAPAGRGARRARRRTARLPRTRPPREAAGDAEAHDLRAMQALAEIKQGDPAAALRTLDGLAPTSLPGRLAQALAYSGAAVMGFATPEPGTATAAECRRLALGSPATGPRW